MTSTTIVCDKCKQRVTPTFNSRLKIGRDVLKCEPVDLCSHCVERLVLIPLGRVTAPLPGLDPPPLRERVRLPRA